MSTIEINNLQKSYGAKNVLRGLNLIVEKGEFWGLIGKNGAGKSTFLFTFPVSYLFFSFTHFKNVPWDTLHS